MWINVGLILLASLFSAQGLAPGGERILQSNEVVPGQYPFMAAVISDIDVLFCGATLISPNYILTGHSCGTGPAIRYAHLGAHDWTNVEEEGRQIIKIANFITPPTERPNSYGPSLGRLESPAVLTDLVQLVRLPPFSETDQFLGTNTLAVGWGSVTGISAIEKLVLNSAQLFVIETSVCDSYYSGSWPETSNMCTSSDLGISPCSDDVGGPLLVYEGDGLVTQIAVIATGTIDCKDLSPYLHYRVTYYLQWIADNSDAVIRP